MDILAIPLLLLFLSVTPFADHLALAAIGDDLQLDVLIKELIDAKLFRPSDHPLSYSLPKHAKAIAARPDSEVFDRVAALIAYCKAHSSTPLLPDLIEDIVWAMKQDVFLQRAHDLIDLTADLNAGRIAFIIKFRCMMIPGKASCKRSIPPPYELHKSFIVGEARERAPIDELLRVFANFVGDSFIGNRALRPGSETKLEGAHRGPAMQYISEFIGKRAFRPDSETKLEGAHHGPAMQYISELVEAAADKAAAAGKSSKNLPRLAHQLRVGSMLNAGTYSYDTFVERIVLLLMDHNLVNEKDAIVLPCGWVTVEGGHSITLEITARADTITFRVYNAGSGVQYHAQLPHQDRINYVPYIEFNRVPRQLFDETDIIFRMLQAAHVEEGYTDEAFYQSILSPLLPYANYDLHLDPSTSTCPAVRTQQAGTCSMKSPKMFVACRSDRPIKDILEKIAIASTLTRLESESCSSTSSSWRFVLIELRANMARRPRKLPSSSAAVPVDTFDDRTRAVIAKLEGCMGITGSSNGLPSRDADVAIDVNKIGKHPYRPPDRIDILTRFDRVTDSGSEMQFRLKQDEDTESGTWSDAAVKGDMGIHLALIVKLYEAENSVTSMNMLLSDILSLPLPPTDGTTWGSLHADDAHKAVDHIDKLVQMLLQSPHSVPIGHHERTIALTQLMTIAWNLIATTDDLKQLTSYALDTARIKLVLFSSNIAPHDIALSKRAADLLSIIKSPFGITPDSSNIIYKLVDKRYVGIVEQHIGWEVEEEADGRPRTTDHIHVLRNTQQIGFLKMISERARMIKDRAIFSKAQQEEIDRKRQSDNVDCSKLVDLIMFMSSWEPLPIGSLHPMRTVHRAFHAIITIGAEPDSWCIGSVSDKPVRRSRTYKQHDVVDRCYSSVQYTTKSTDPYSDDNQNHYFLVSEVFHPYRGGSSRFDDDQRYFEKTSNRPSELFAHFGANVPDLVKNLYRYEYMSDKIVENAILIKGKSPLEIKWLNILSASWSSLPRLLYEWRSGHIDDEDVDEQAMIAFALFRNHQYDHSEIPSQWAISAPIAQSIFQSIRESMDLKLKAARRHLRSGSSITAASTTRSNALSFLFAIAFRIVSAVKQSSSSSFPTKLFGRAMTTPVDIGLIDTTSVWAQLQHDLAEFSALHSSSSSSSRPHERSLLATARVLSWTSDTNDLKELLLWQSRRVGTHASDYLHHPANMIVARRARSIVTMVTAMNDKDRTDFITDLIINRHGVDPAINAVVGRLSWNCGVQKTWCIGVHGDNTCQLDLLFPDLICSIAGHYREWRLVSFSLYESSWYLNGRLGGLHGYPTTSSIRIITNTPVTFHIANKDDESIWRDIYVAFDVDDISQMTSSMRPDRVRLYLRHSLAHYPSTLFFIQSDMAFLTINHPDLKLPRPLHINSDADAFHVWVSVNTNNQVMIITDHAGHVVIMAIIRDSTRLYSTVGEGASSISHLDIDNCKWSLQQSSLKLSSWSFDLSSFVPTEDVSLFLNTKRQYRLVFRHVFIDGHPLIFSSNDGNRWVWERFLPLMHISRDQQLAGFDLRFVPGMLLLEGATTRRAIVLSRNNQTVALVDLRRDRCAATGQQRDVFVPSSRLDRLIVVHRLLFAGDYRQAFDLLRGVDVMMASDTSTIEAMGDILENETNHPMAVCIRLLVILIDIRLTSVHGHERHFPEKQLPSLERYWQLHRNIPFQYRLLASDENDDHHGLFLSRSEEIDLLKSMMTTRSIVARLSWLGAYQPDQRPFESLSRRIETTTSTLVISHASRKATIRSQIKACHAMKEDRAVNDVNEALRRYNPLFVDNDGEIAMFNLLFPALFKLSTNEKLMATRVWTYLQLRAHYLEQHRRSSELTDRDHRQALLAHLLYARFPTDKVHTASSIIVQVIANNQHDKNIDLPEMTMKTICLTTSYNSKKPELRDVPVPSLPIANTPRLTLSTINKDAIETLLIADRESSNLLDAHIDFTINEPLPDDVEYYKSKVKEDLLPDVCINDVAIGFEFACKRADQIVIEASRGFHRLHTATGSVPRWKNGGSDKVVMELGNIRNDLEKEMTSLSDQIRGIIVDSRYNDHIGAGDDLATFQWQSLMPLLVLSSINAYRSRLPNMSDDNINKLHISLFKMALLGTSLQHVDRALAAKNSVDVVARELGQKRQSTDVLLRHPELVVFELMTNIRLRDDQVDDITQLTELKSGTYPPMILQRLMAAGKTFVIGTLMALLKADGYHLSVIVPPSSLFESNAQNMIKWSREFLGQHAQIIMFERTPYYRRADTLRTLHITLINAIKLHRYVLMSPSTAHSIENSFISAVDELTRAVDHVDALRAEVKELAAILSLLRDRAVATFDEIDMTMDPKKEHNFASGDREMPSSLALDAVTDIYLFALVSPDVRQHVNLLANQQSLLDTNTYIDHIRPLLIARAIADTCSLVDEGETWLSTSITCSMTRVFLQSSSPAIDCHWATEPLSSDSDKNLLDHIAVLHDFIYKQIPSSWSSTVNLNYGRSSDPTNVLPVPFVAANTPADSSEFADAWEIITRACQLYSIVGLDLDQTRHLMNSLTIGAHRELEDDPKLSNLDNTKSAKRFNDIMESTMVISDSMMEGDACLVQQITLSSMGRSDMDCVRQRLSPSEHSGTDHIYLLMQFVRDNVLPRVGVASRQIIGTPQNLVAMFRSVQGYSGTLENTYVFAHDIDKSIDTSLRLDAGANGQVLHKILRGGTVVHNLLTMDVASLLHTIADDISRPFTALIDIGAAFKGIKNVDVANEMITMFQEQIIKGIVSREFPIGVLYFDETSNSLRAIIKRDMDSTMITREIAGTDPSAIAAATGLTNKDLFTYYDHRHITGTDIAQSVDARAIATVSSTSTSLRDILQGVMRMRRLLTTQSIEFAIQSATDINIGKILKQAQMLQFKQEMKQNRQAARQKLDNAIRDGVLKHMYAANDPVELIGVALPILFRSIDLSKTATVLSHAMAVPTIALLKQRADQIIRSLPVFIDRDAISDTFKVMIDHFPNRDDMSIGELDDMSCMEVIAEQQQQQQQEQQKVGEQESEMEMLQDSRNSEYSPSDPSRNERFKEVSDLRHDSGAPLSKSIARGIISRDLQSSWTIDNNQYSRNDDIVERTSQLPWKIMADILLDNDYTHLNINGDTSCSEPIFSDAIRVHTSFFLCRNYFKEFSDMMGRYRKRPSEVLMHFYTDGITKKRTFRSITMVSPESAGSKDVIISKSRGAMFVALSGTPSPGPAMRDDTMSVVMSMQARMAMVDVLLYDAAVAILDRPEWVPYVKKALQIHPFKREFLRRFWFTAAMGIVDDHYRNSHLKRLLAIDAVDMGINEGDIRRFRVAMRGIGVDDDTAIGMIKELFPDCTVSASLDITTHEDDTSFLSPWIWSSSWYAQSNGGLITGKQSNRDHPHVIQSPTSASTSPRFEDHQHVIQSPPSASASPRFAPNGADRDHPHVNQSAPSASTSPRFQPNGADRDHPHVIQSPHIGINITSLSTNGADTLLKAPVFSLFAIVIVTICAFELL